MSLMQVHDKADLNDIVLRDQISKIVFLVLPQISSVLVKVCEEETLKGSSLVQVATKTLGRYLCLVFEDYERNAPGAITNEDFITLVKKANEMTEEDNLLQPKNQTQADYIKNLKKSNQWLRAASKRLVPLITRVKSLQGSEHSKIRYELALFSWNLLDRCLVNVRPLAPFLLENLILFADDSNSKVREFSQKSLKELSLKIPELNREISELFSAHLIAMPRIILTGDDDEQVAGFTLLNSFIIAITQQDSQLSSLLDNPVILDRFLQVIISSCEIAVPDELLFYENLASVSLIDQYYQMKTPWKQFKNLKNDSVVKKFSEICQNLGKSTSAQVCLDFLLNDMNSLEYLVVIIEMLQCGQATSLKQDQVEGIVEEFLSETYWTLKTCATERVEKQKQRGHEEWFKDQTLGLYESAIEVRLTDVSLEDGFDQSYVMKLKTIKYNILCTCLVVELMGAAAKILGKDFQRFLLRTLHRVLEKAGNSNFIIRSSGLHSLESISTAMGFTEVSQLIDENADFLLFNIQKLLKRNHDNNSVFDMLSVVFKYSRRSMILYIEDIVQTASEKVTNHKLKANASSYLKLFSLYVGSIKNWEASCDANLEEKIDEDWDEFFKLCLFELEKSPQDDEQCTLDEAPVDNEEQMNNEENAEPTEDPGEPVELPTHIKLMKKVLISTLQFFASNKMSEVILAHEIFIDGLPILEGYENEYLPMVHQMWYPFSKQFQVQNFVVLQHSFRLLSSIARPAQDVILNKSTSDVIPKINKFLQQTLKASSSKVNLSYTQEFKLQHEILSGYGALAADLDLDDKLLDEIVEVLLKYEKISNEKLANASRQSLDVVRNLNPGLLFYKRNV